MEKSINDRNSIFGNQSEGAGCVIFAFCVCAILGFMALDTYSAL